MNDIERLRDWMNQRELTTRQMATEMGMPFQTVYHALVVRGEKAGNGGIAGNLIVRFIATYGYEEAAQIFGELMQKTESDQFVSVAS